jgi:raffinose/stachyose/melibiose transport system permease protein
MNTLTDRRRTSRHVVKRRHGFRPARTVLTTGAVHLVLIVFVIISIGPVLLIIMNSFKNQIGIFTGPFALPTADTFSLGGYVRALTLGSFGSYYRNSLIVTLGATALTVIFGALAAFAITEYKVRLGPLLAGFFIVGIMLPVHLGTVAILRMMVSLHLLNTPVALILVYTGMSVPLGVILMVTNFRSVPIELKEAARIDGANERQTLLIVLPLVRPGLAAVAAITMLPIWNDLWFPLILASSENSQTVTLGVQQFVGQHLNDWPALLASLVLGAVPLVILFSIFSKQFIKGLSEGYGK